MFLNLVVQLVTQLVAAILVLPTPPPFQRRTREYPADMSTMEKLAAHLEDFDESDCFADPVTCACRLLGSRESNAYCFADDQTGRAVRTSDGNATVVAELQFAELMLWMSEHHFNGHTPCDHLVQLLANRGQGWTETLPAQRKQWQECVVHRTRGMRLADYSPLFPVNYYYSHNATWTVADNMARKVNEDAAKIRESNEANQRRRRRVHESRQEERDEYLRDTMEMDNALVDRSVYVRKSGLNYGIPEESPLLEMLVRADAMEYKFKTGYYARLVSDYFIAL
jgi:hypothetical protein